MRLHRWFWAVGMCVLLAAGCSTTGTFAPGEIHAVDSTLIKSVEYDDITEDLTLTFQDGGVYVHRDVPRKIYRGLMEAKSKGAYYHKRIKGQYTAEKK